VAGGGAPLQEKPNLPEERERAVDTTYLQFKTADLISRIVPRAMAHWIGKAVADWFYVHDHVGRAGVVSNLRRILEFRSEHPTNETLRSLARQTFRNSGKHMVDFFRYREITKRHIGTLMHARGLEYIDQARSLGRGALLVTAHLGSWDLGGALIAAHGYPIHAVTLPHTSPRSNELLQSRRDGRGVHVIPLGRAARDMLRFLKQGDLVAVAADRDYLENSDLIPFFGAPARFPRGAAVLCARRRIPIVPGFMLRQKDDTFFLRMHPPILPEAGRTVRDVQSALCRIMEREIGEYPTQWFTFKDFWDDQPFDGAAGIAHQTDRPGQVRPPPGVGS